MERMMFTTNGIGRQRRTVVEIIKIDAGFLGNTQTTMHLAKSRLDFEQALEETIEMTIKGATSSEATIEMTPEITGQIMGLGSRDLSCPLRR
jgi:hypothetical protein